MTNEKEPAWLRRWRLCCESDTHGFEDTRAALAHIDALTRERAELRENLEAKSETQRIDLSTWLASEADAAKARAEWRERSAETLGVLREILAAVKAHGCRLGPPRKVEDTERDMLAAPAAQPEVPPMPEEPHEVKAMRAHKPGHTWTLGYTQIATIVDYIDALKARTFPASGCGGAT